MRLKDKAALVTGAGSGIGRAVCLRFAEEGAAVLASDIHPENCRETVRQVRAAGGRAEECVADAGKEADCRRMVDQCVQAFGKIDVLVNNAARFVLKGLEATPEDWRQVMETNVYGYAYLSRFASERMAAGGSIVNLASISSVVAQAGMVTYNASKGAVLQMTRCAAMDLAPRNIRVNCVCPGFIWTGQTQKMAAEAGLTKQQAAERWAAPQLLKRCGEPVEVANAILFLASDESSFCTGSALFVDGGHTTG